MTARRRLRPGFSSAVVGILLLTALAAGWLQSRREAPPAPTSSVVTAGDRYDLARDEQRGGHTLERHVGWSESDLIDRLRREPGISAASTYVDRDTAERVVAQTLWRFRSRVDAWLARDGQRPNLALDYRGEEPIGMSVRRGARQAVVCTDAVVVLRWDRGESFYVLTSYPESSR
jgi:hypothetical protein